MVFALPDIYTITSTSNDGSACRNMMMVFEVNWMEYTKKDYITEIENHLILYLEMINSLMNKIPKNENYKNQDKNN